MDERTLLEALGSPSLESLPPFATAAEWTMRRNILRTLLLPLGCRAPLRTPAALWAAAVVVARHGRSWSQLAGLPLSGLAARMRRATATGPLQLATWNARWLTTPHTEQGTRKRAFINEMLMQGAIVALQETHWKPGVGAMWGALFPGASLVHTDARPPPGL